MTQTPTGSDSSSTDQAKDKAAETTQQAKEKAQEATQQARGQVSSQLDDRSTQAGEQVGTTAQALRKASEQLREDGQDAPARAVDRAAGQAERAGSWLRDADGDQILRDVEDFGRRNPLAVVAGGVALGFALSRMLKASSDRRSGSSSSSGLSAYRTDAGNGLGGDLRPEGTRTLPETTTPASPAGGAYADSDPVGPPSPEALEAADRLKDPTPSGGIVGGEGEGSRPTAPPSRTSER